MDLSVELILLEWAAGMVAALVFVRRIYAIGRGFTLLIGGAATAAAVLASIAAGWPPNIFEDAGALDIVRAVAGSLFLGFVTVGMVVGHWYLIDPRLPREVIRKTTYAFLLATALETLVLVPGGMWTEITGSRRDGFTTYLPPFWVAVLLLTIVLGLGVLGALRERGYPAVMAATGLFYLAVLTAFGVEILGKALITRAL